MPSPPDPGIRHLVSGGGIFQKQDPFPTHGPCTLVAPGSRGGFCTPTEALDPRWAVEHVPQAAPGGRQMHQRGSLPGKERKNVKNKLGDAQPQPHNEELHNVNRHRVTTCMVWRSAPGRDPSAGGGASPEDKCQPSSAKSPVPPKCGTFAGGGPWRGAIPEESRRRNGVVRGREPAAYRNPGVYP